MLDEDSGEFVFIKKTIEGLYPYLDQIWRSKGLSGFKQFKAETL